ncbi:MAG: site-specific DNA-methyltransferase [Polaromonas sp.]|nr:site-specific DNA-methyltransferase [Polaromonas sp.]
MPTLDWLNRATAFTTAAKVPFRLLEQVSVHVASAGNARNSIATQAVDTPASGQNDVQNALDFAAARPEPVEGSPKASTSSARTGIFDNLLIQGDNLEALKALLPFYRGQVKCIFIDPPYNTKSAFEHYDDNLEHAQWLSMMLPRLQLLRELLREDGSIWVTIDDNEGHYLKVLMDEVFGRGNFVSTVIWQKKYAPKSDSKYLSESHDFILGYAKKLSALTINRLKKGDKQNDRYTNKDNDPRGPWKPDNVLRTEARDYAIFPVRLPSGREVLPPNGTSWRYTKDKFAELIADNRVWFGLDGNGRPAYKRFLSEVTDSMPATTIWTFDEVGHNDESKKEMRGLFSDDLFGTPKPERLLQRILHIATNEGDLVLDSFLGSGTTAAVAHKMGRRWIGIEMGEHAATHCLPRLQKVLDGEQGGISKAVGWGQDKDGAPFAGGGFRFMRLGEAVFDDKGRINPAVRFATLAAFIWQQDTGTTLDLAASLAGTPHIGTHYENNSAIDNEYAGYSQFNHINPTGTAYYLLYNGILGDKRPASGNVLTRDVLAALLDVHAKVQATAPEAAELDLVVYGEACRLGEERLKQAKVTFRHIPYDVRAR